MQHSRNPMRPFSYSKPTAPLLLSSSVTIRQGQSGVPDVAALASPFREPIIIDEIRFRADLSTGGLPDGDQLAGILCRFRMGRIELSPKDIPVSLYTTAMQQGAIESVNLAPGTVGTTQVTHRRWKLPIPLYVPAGSSLVPTFSRIPQAGATDSGIQVFVSYAGRYMDSSEPMPKKIQVPYVTAFYPNVAGWFDGTAMSGAYSSQEFDLANVLPVQIRAQRFIGRIFQFNAAGGTLYAFEVTDNGTTGAGGYVVELKDSYGREVVKDGLNFGSLFDVNRRAWTFSKILGSRERYMMKIRNTSAPANPEIPMVSLIGWREEEFS